MSTYVDNMRAPVGRMLMCHMIADSTEELLSMVDKIGVDKKWIQKAGTPDEHFDVSIGMRKKAIDRGAIKVSPRQLVKIIQNKRQAKR